VPCAFLQGAVGLGDFALLQQHCTLRGSREGCARSPLGTVISELSLVKVNHLTANFKPGAAAFTAATVLLSMLMLLLLLLLSPSTQNPPTAARHTRVPGQHRVDRRPLRCGAAHEHFVN
jgi:hypothetical protein